MIGRVDIEDLLPRVLTYAPQAPEPLVVRALRWAATELCERAKLWRDTDAFDVTRPEDEGVLTIEDAQIHQIEWAKLDGDPLDPVTLAWLDENLPDWTSNETGPARYITQKGPNTVTVVPIVAGHLTLRMVLKPSAHALTLPDFLAEQYPEQLADGAASRVLTTPNSDFANPALGAAKDAKFMAWLDTISVRAAKGQQRARLRAKAQFM